MASSEEQLSSNITLSLDFEVRKAQIDQIYHQGQNALIGQPLAGIFALAYLWPSVPTIILLTWIIIIAAVQILRYYHTIQYRKHKPILTIEDANKWGRIHAFGMALSALIWSMGLIVFFITGNHINGIGYLMIVTATVAAAIIGHIAYRPSYTVYLILIFIPMAITYLSVDTAYSTLLGINCIAAFAILLRIADRSYASSVESIIVGIKYRTQATNLAEEKARAETLNQQLQQQTQALRESEARFRGLSQSTFEGLAIHEDGKILDANRSALEMFGYEHHEIKSLLVEDLISPEFYEVTINNMRNKYEEPYEVVGIRKDQSVFPMEIQAKTVSYGNRIVRVVAVRDLTFRRQAEQQALDLIIEQERVRLMEQFFENASHEFRTPLSIINTATYVMRKTSSADQQKQKLDLIDDQVKRINQLVNDLGLLLKLDNSLDVTCESVQLSSLIGRICQHIGDEITQKKLSITTTLTHQQDSIHGNSELLEKAFYALLENAMRYTEENGNIVIDSRQDNRMVSITIKDSGIGINEDDLPHVFDRFYRVDSSHSTMGFGIGLSIARRIVELHNGTIELESIIGQGTTITVQLPLAIETIAAACP